jgi:hypothetical protein
LKHEDAATSSGTAVISRGGMAITPMGPSTFAPSCRRCATRCLVVMAYAASGREALALRRSVGATLHVHGAYPHSGQKASEIGRARSVAVIGPLADEIAVGRERTECAEPRDLVCPSLTREDRAADALRQGGQPTDPKGVALPCARAAVYALAGCGMRPSCVSSETWS